METLGFILPSHASDRYRRLADICRRQLCERGGPGISLDSEGESTIRLRIDPGCPHEGFRLSGDADVCISAADERGLLYGLGALLHDADIGAGRIAFGPWRGASQPANPFRGMYLAVHFHNWYEQATVEALRHYIEDLALWGMNHVVLHFPQRQFTGPDDPAARELAARMRLILEEARALGLRTGLLQAPNQGWSTAPDHVRAEPVDDALARRGSLGLNCCPSKPLGFDYLLDIHRSVIEMIGPENLQWLCSWPYDEGGCGCDDCRPWGANGFLRLSRAMAALTREANPACKLCLSTWCFDTPEEGEWPGLSAALAEDGAGVDMILADAHEDFPRYPLDAGVPGGLPLISFPEISMWGMLPWGGCGATPLPRRFERLWRSAAQALSGSLPYSEGIYEDINKVLCCGWAWSPKASAEEILQRYAGYEFGRASAEVVVEACFQLEEQHERHRLPAALDRSRRIALLLAGAETGMDASRLQAWRWRLLRCRADIDALLADPERAADDGELLALLAELRELYQVTPETKYVLTPNPVPSLRPWTQADE